MLEILFRHRSSAVLLLVLPLLAWSLGARDPAASERLAGLAALAAGGLLRLLATRRIGRGARVQRADVRGGLATTGPYAWSRNPLYVAAGLILAGLGLLAGGGWWALLLLPATFAVYTPVVLHEEGVIAVRLGEEYEAYRRAVWRWIGPPGDAGAPPPDPAPWSEVMRREVGLLPGLAVAAGAVTLVREEVVPLRALGARLSEAAGLPVEVLIGLALGAGILGNVLTVERKRRRRARRAAADVVDAGAAAPPSPDA